MASISFNERLDRLADVFLHLFTDRFTNLGPDYDPDIQNPLSEDQISQFSQDVSHVFANEGTTGIYEVIERLKDEETSFLEEMLFPEMNQNINQDHFPKSFSRFLTTALHIDLDLLSMLPDFPEKDAFSRLLKDFCIEKIYGDYQEPLLTVVFDGLGQIRLLQENIVHNEKTAYLVKIGRNFSSDEESLFHQLYFAKLKEHSANYAANLEVNTTTFINKAFERASAEELIANSVRIDGMDNITKVKRYAIDGFCVVYNESEPQQVFIDMFEQTEDQEKFQRLLRLYGHSNAWQHIMAQLKEKIYAKGDAMRDQLQALNNNWTMPTLCEAVRGLAIYEMSVYDRLRPAENREIERLPRTVRSSFRRNFREMFPHIQGMRRPEEILADFVEFLISLQEEDVDIQATLTLAEWREEMLGYVHRLIPHMHDKYEFMRKVESWIRVFSFEEGRQRNRDFYNFLGRQNMRNYVSPELREALLYEISQHHVTLQEVSVMPSKIVETYSNGVMTGSNDSTLIDLVHDCKLLYVVSIPRFAGSRKSIYLRMTRLQMEVLNSMLVWKELRLQDLHKTLIREDVLYGHEEAVNDVNLIVETLVFSSLLTKTPNTVLYNTNDIIRLREGYYEAPYINLPLPLEGFPGIATEKKYEVDIAICEAVRTANAVGINNLFYYVLETVPGPLSLLQARLDLLKDRGFLFCPEGQPNVFVYITPTS